MKPRAKRMRLDFKEFQRQRRAGVIVIVLFIAASLIAFAGIWDTVAIGGSYLEVSGHQIPSSQALENLLEKAGKPVAVMFRSENCPVCKAMYPYWAVLEQKSGELPLDFYDIMYTSATAEAFAKYGVEETPTFIVFVDGEPVARHVGGFQGANITRAMLLWARAASGAARLEPGSLASEGLEIYNRKCSMCHGMVGGFNQSLVRGWVEAQASRGDRLGEAIARALEENRSLVDLYGGWGGLRDAVMEMRKYVDISPYEADRLAYFLAYTASIAAGREPPEPPLTNTTATAILSGRGEATRLEEQRTSSSAAFIVALAAAVAAGVVAAFSPCTFPLLLAMVTSLARSGRETGVKDCVACLAAGIAGVAGLGAVFLVASPVAGLVQNILLPIVAAAVIVAGAASLLGVPVELAGLIRARKSIVGFCAAYGFLAVQCNLPLVVGALMLILTAGDIASAAITLLGFAAGISVPVALAVYAKGPVQGLIARASARTQLIERIGGAVMLGAGVFLLAYSLGLLAY